MLAKIIYILLFLSCSIEHFKSEAATIEQKATTAAIELRNRLVQKIDSLDIEKQRLKRTGENFDDIEVQQSRYADSLSALKQSIQSGLQQPAQQEPVQLPFSINDFINPQSSLDWVILITSTVAVLSFIFMIIAIIRTRRKNSMKKKNATIQLKHTAVRHAPAEAGRDLPLQVHDDNAGKAQKRSSLPDSQQLTPINPLDQIKKKIHEASDYYEKTEPPRPSTRRIKTVDNVEKEDIEAIVYEEYKKGADIHEISKTFQISADHVSLLLKIRGIDPNKGSTK